MSTGGGTTVQQTSQNTAPWAPSQPYLTDLMGQAQNQYNTSAGNTGYYPGNTVVDPSSTTMQGLNLTAQRAIDGSPLTAQAGSSLMNLMQPQTAPGNQALTGLTNGYADPGSAMTQAGAGPNPYLAQLAGQMGQQNAATGLASGLASSGPQMAGNATLQAGANGQFNNPATALAAFQAMRNPNANPSQANLGGMASGAQINPFIDSLYNSVSKPVIDQVNAQFGAGGRTGSGANQQLLTRDLGDLSAQVRAPAWEQAVQNQLAANGQVQGAFDNASARNLSATGLMGQLSGQDTSNRLSAAQNLNSGNLAAYGAQGNAAGLLGQLSGQDMSRNADLSNQLAGYGDTQQQRMLAAGGQLSSNALNQAQTVGTAANNLNSQFNTGNNLQFGAAQAAPGLANNDYTDLQNLMNVGGAYDSQSAANINDALTRWQYQQQQPWNLLDNYSGLLTGYAGLGGQSSGTQTVKQPSQSLIPSLLGTAIGGLTGGLGSAAGAAMFSDRRLKTDIRQIGRYENGLPKYRFRFKGHKQLHVGPMAQDVLAFRPQAVCVMPTGYLGVDYKLALAA